MTAPSPERQREIKDLLDDLFEEMLKAFAETDCFSRESSPSIFLVYAHENPSAGTANAAWAVQLIRWLGAVRSKTFSDKSLVPGLWATREEVDFASVHDVLSNQFCLLPARSRAAKGKRVTRVDKVIVCCSEVLQSYSKDTRTDEYTNAIKEFYSHAEMEHQDAEAIEEGIQELVRQYRSEWFHHVITELVFLDIRSSRAGSRHYIIPIVFNGNDITYLRCFDKAQTVWLKMQDNLSMVHPCQVLHKTFFKVLRRLYEDEERWISEFDKCYEECVHSLLSQEHLPSQEAFMETIRLKRAKALNSLASDRYATLRVSPDAVHELPGLWSVPFEKNPSFVGRESLIQDIENNLSSVEFCQRVALWGLGGTGKTQVALEYAYRIRKATPGCSVFWIPAISATTFEKSYLNIGKLLKIPGISDSNADVKKLVQDKLNDESTGEWLIVVDNADNVGVIFKETSHGSKPLIDFLPSGRRGSIIFTTRTREAAVKQVQAKDNRIEVTEMSKPESEDLLKKILGEKPLLQEPKAVNELLNLLAHLPLAIIQAASFIAENGIQLAEYISAFKSSETDTIKMLSENFEDRHRYREIRNPIATTWLVSFERIQEKDPLTASYLKFIACLLRENIPQSLLPKGQSTIDEMRAIGTLTAYSFLVKQQKPQMFDMHRLVHLVTRNWLKDQNQLASQIKIAMSRVSEALPYGGHKDSKIWAEYLPHAIYIATSSKEVVEWKARVILLDRTGQCQQSLGQYRASEETHRQVLDLRKTRLGVNNSSTLRSMNCVAVALSSQGKYAEAEKMYQETLALREKLSGKEHLGTLGGMNNLALTLSDQGKYAEAEKMYQETVALREKVLGKEHPDTLTSINNLAWVLSNQGKYTKAEKMHRETLALREKVLGKEHPETLGSMNNLVLTLGNQGKYAEAEKMQLETLALREKVSGKEHPDTLTSMNNLALTLSNKGKYAEAEKMHRETLALREKVSGEEHPETLASINNLALTLSDQGKYAEAEKMHRETLALREKVLGKDHPHTLVSMKNLNCVIDGQNKTTATHSKREMSKYHP